ncbi:MAG TPA: polysaccharide deacetylase family protein [Gemmatimonadales bacterium]|nr:polysaccharide deacetylase family protein [Gemmatimonadales bacterium]
MRALGKQLAERAAVLAGVHRWGARGSSVVLAYHNIVPDGDRAMGDRSLHLPEREFVDQVDALLESHEVVPIEQVFVLPTASSSAKGRAAITFDDAYYGALVVGWPHLRRRGLPATMFVPPGCLGGQSFWWDELADPATGTLDRRIRNYGLDTLGGAGQRIRGWAAERGIATQTLPAHARSGTDGDVREAAAGGLRVASHTWSHINLATSDEATGREELTRTSSWLADHYPSHPTWLAYPYGAASSRSADLARAAGHQGALLVSGGPFEPGAPIDRYRIPRVNVPAGVSVDGFRLRVAGVVTR